MPRAARPSHPGSSSAATWTSGAGPSPGTASAGSGRSRTRWGRHPLHRHQPDRPPGAAALRAEILPERPDGEPAEGPQASPGLRSDFLHESLRQPSPALFAWRRLLVALDLTEPHAEAVALARGPVRHPPEQADQARY